MLILGPTLHLPKIDITFCWPSGCNAFIPCLCSSEDEDFGPLRRGSPESSEDEFEREMESEVTGTLEMMVSPTAIQAMQTEGGGRRRKGGGENVTARPGPSGKKMTILEGCM